MCVFSEKYVYIIMSLLVLYSGRASIATKHKSRFPHSFQFGATTAAYQIEGAWNVDGKGWSAWDHFVHTRKDLIIDKSTGDDAAKSYYLYKRDVEMLNELGADAYRFSISWSRILPYGHPDYINPLGVAYYNNLIDALLASGITPFVTLFHWDLPHNLNEQGGWLNKKCVDWFGNYARVAYKMFGDRVKNWITVNEPDIHCVYGFERATHPPALKLPGDGYYECGRNMILGHARAYHIYKNEFKSLQNGWVGFAGNMEWGIPATDSFDDREATMDYNAFHVDYFIHPIYSKDGNWPQRAIDRIKTNSFKEGRNSSRLREYTEEEVKYIRGTADFLGLNFYVTELVYRNSSLNGTFKVPSLENDIYAGSFYNHSWPTHMWVHDYPPGFYSILTHLRDKYDDPIIFVTENGMPSEDGLVDGMRSNYFKHFLGVVLDAMNDGVDIRGYFPWSLMDNFEWLYGFRLKFGLYHVDMADENRTRIPKKSALVYKEIVRSREIDYDYDPDPYKYSFGSAGTYNKRVENVCDAAGNFYTETYLVLLLALLNIYA